MSLQDLVLFSAWRVPDAIAIKGADTCITYAELDNLSNSFARAFLRVGVRAGDRVGIWHEKSASVIAAMQGALRIGAIYVPLDPLCPVARIHVIIEDCAMKALVTTQKRFGALQAHSGSLSMLEVLCLDGEGDSSMGMLRAESVGVSVRYHSSLDDIAYILYTSGSTGTPKGVCISNQNALAFIDWAAETLQVNISDHFANHAPFHFDLSVLDLYVALKVGASVCLISDSVSYMPKQLVKILYQEALTIWYSVPSALILMMEQGGLFEQDVPALRVLLYAGEPFPIKHLARLFQHFAPVRLLNLYGPTETNVCTYYEVTALPDEQSKSVPIGRACSGDTVWVRKEDGTIAEPGEEGELMVSGPTVMVGYWGRPPYGKQSYATGDLVRQQSDGNYLYLGRRDHMVKIRGYRIEIGDIEAALEAHPSIQEAAVVVNGSGMEARLIAFIACLDEDVPSLLEVKRHCADRVPRYMIVDMVHVLPLLPRTRNGKIDRQALSQGLFLPSRAV